jgi:Na+/H+ antiporter NhaB
MIVQNDVMNSPKTMSKHGDNDMYYILNGILVASMSDTFFIGTGGVTVSLFAQNV